MDCFENFIGIKSCDTALNPRTGLFIEDLEGINLDHAASVAEEETGVELFQRKLAFAYQKLKSDIIQHVQQFVRIGTVVENKRVGRFVDTYLANDASERGIHIERDNTRLTKIYVQSVTIKVNDTTTDKEFKIIDGDVETTYTFSGSPGDEVTVITDYTATRDEIFVVMDNSDVQVNETSLYDSDCGCIANNYKYFNINGWNGTRNDSITYGMQVNVNMECSDDDLICIFNHRLGLAALYRAGIEILNEAIESDRLNYVTIYGEEKAMEKKAEWEALYENELNSKVAGIKDLLQKLDDVCLDCRSSRILKQMP